MPGGSVARKSEVREDSRRSIKVSREAARVWDIIAAVEETSRDRALEEHGRRILAGLKAEGRMP